MIYEASPLAIIVFLLFVAATLAISFYFGSKAKSSAGYFAAHGQIPWFVNGVAFAGDYLSAASFLGICGMIAFYGYDGFLYSIGFLAGWIVALFVVAEPMKRLGKFTFADALNAKFDSKGIKIAAGISTLAVSLFYLIPQMVGAGVLVQPLLGLDHWVGVVLVGVVVIMIVVSAGMVSTTWVQFLKGGLLIIFSAILVFLILSRGFSTEGEERAFRTLGPLPKSEAAADSIGPAIPEMPELLDEEVLPVDDAWSETSFVRTKSKTTGVVTVWSSRVDSEGNRFFDEAQTMSVKPDGKKLANGISFGDGEDEGSLLPIGSVSKLPEGKEKTGPLGPLSFFSTLQESEVVLWRQQKVHEADGTVTTVYYQDPTPGSQILRPGEHPKFKGIRSDNWIEKLDFLSLMLALFAGTASLPHILIRYYTVKDEASARKSTIVGIACIGFFYVLTMYLGLGAMTSGAMDVTNSNMAAPLLAKSMSDPLFAIISAIAFTTVLGTVSGLILASAGAVTHDLLDSILAKPLDDDRKVVIAKASSVVIGTAAIVLGILFKDLNVSYLVGWAFSVAASANLPALVMLLFWPKVTKQGIIAGVLVGMISSLAWILLSADTYSKVYGLPASDAPMPFSQPGIVTIPLGFIALVVFSLVTQPYHPDEEESSEE